jgi:hypothetical protein
LTPAVLGYGYSMITTHGTRRRLGLSLAPIIRLDLVLQAQRNVGLKSGETQGTKIAPILNEEVFSQSRNKLLTLVSVLLVSVLSCHQSQTKIGNSTAAWSDDNEPAFRPQDSANLEAGSANVFDVLRGTDGDDTVKEIIFNRYELGAAAYQR